MQFNVQSLPQEVRKSCVRVGNVYPAQGNKPTSMWVVVANNLGRVHLLGLDESGEVCSAQTYGEHAMAGRPVIGFCAAIESMRFDVEFTGMPRSFREGV